MDTDEARKKGAVEETGLPPVSAMEDMPSGDPSDYSAFVESGSGGGAPDWHALAKTGTLPQLRAAVEAHGAEGLSVASTDMWTKLPIHIAAESGKSVEAVRYLVEQGGADTLTAEDGAGRLAIHLAAESGKSAEAVQYLVEQGGAETLAAKDGGGMLAIHWAAKYSKSVEVARYLVEQGGADTLTVKDCEGKLAIHWAAQYSKSAEAVRYLVEQGGADTLTARDACGTLAIHYAAQYSKSAEAVRYLAEQGGAATLTAKDVLGNLAIHLAAARDRNESVEVVRCLAEQGPSTLKVPDEQGRDALTLAKSSYHKAVQQWANTHGCELGRYRVDDDQIHHRCAPNTRRRASPPRCFPHACFFASMHARTC
jgi:ankyrin repeat protein